MANNLGAILCGGENLLCDFSHIFSRTCGKRHNALSEKDGSIKCEGKFSKEHNIVKNSKDEINICGKNNYDVSGCYNTCNDEKEYIYDGQPTKFSINNIYLNFKNNKTENEKILNDVTKLGNEICDEKINCICIKSGAREQNNCGENYYPDKMNEYNNILIDRRNTNLIGNNIKIEKKSSSHLYTENTKNVPFLQDNNPVQETYNFGNVDNSIALNNSNCSKNNNIKNDDNESNNIMEPQTHNNDNFPKTDISSINNNESSYPSSEFMSVVSCGKVDE
ncbi:conserved rodent malaria protein, unknown function [Plasmodium berghei]|uniref:Uncharacterized protein n=2 Tax=Plasmodium berghei TaxID=5821 RepID=A0A509AD44_PLABA|nr:conserved Plasmodium protein, unknown function [Plasmodium berghei ANKA]CXI00908.1 conserved rodent malaria protein, unknown function [Plasmodium berghei]SCL91747.1 conserved rodent malaria protein, unknown function [Plasmodium berghei]SCM15525.1 conserved rodent malaria protein, unknown function [Plasmodium berghei]SCM17317.1 conserved rodent malaria protein, unknown function [Plasmodium berghei]SCN22524.1 conserved rodent malaria protein, unknown function [Plasmodium berghei]|eukprot:XP_034420123.1 conserved Plasmodium protein, unknown function [Plasmodium berghei ANKA]